MYVYKSEQITVLIFGLASFRLLNANTCKVYVAIGESKLVLGCPPASACTPKKMPYLRLAERELVLARYFIVTRRLSHISWYLSALNLQYFQMSMPHLQHQNSTGRYSRGCIQLWIRNGRCCMYYTNPANSNYCESPCIQSGTELQCRQRKYSRKLESVCANSLL